MLQIKEASVLLNELLASFSSIRQIDLVKSCEIRRRPRNCIPRLFYKCYSFLALQYPRQGSNRSIETREKLQANEDALQNPVQIQPKEHAPDLYLARVVEAWPALSDRVRQAILDLIR